MKSAWLVLPILSSAIVLSHNVCAQNVKIEEVGKSPVEAKFASGGEVHMDLCSGGVRVKGVEGDNLRVSYTSGRDWTDHVKIRIRTDGNRAEIRSTGCPHNNFRMTIEVPKSSNLHARMFAGELDVSGISGNKDVRLSAGQLSLDIGDPKDYARVEASVSTGDLESPAFNISKGGLFRSFERNGPGKYQLRAHVGAGELDLR